jgi:hypothetical protein
VGGRVCPPRPRQFLYADFRRQRLAPFQQMPSMMNAERRISSWIQSLWNFSTLEFGPIREIGAGTLRSCVWLYHHWGLELNTPWPTHSCAAHL